MRARSVLTCAVLAAVLTATIGGGYAQAVANPAMATSTSQEPAHAACSQQNRRASLPPLTPLPVPHHMPAGSTMDRIAQRGYLIVGVLEDTYPFSFRNQRLTFEGFDIDVARDIAAAIFGDPGRVVFRPVTEADRLPAVTSNRVDLVVASLTVDCKRRAVADFSAVYYEAGQRILVNRGSAVASLNDLGGQRVCAGRGTTSLTTILAAASKPIPVAARTETDCLMLLQLGEVDAVSTDDTLLVGMAAQDRRTEVVGPRFTEEPYAVATSKKAPDLVRFVNAVLERRVQDGRWRASYEHWLGLLGPPPAPPIPSYQD